MSLPTLLLIDDDVEFLAAQTAALSNEYHLLAAEGVTSALELLQNNEIDCVLVDYFLNDGNGHDVASWVAKNRPWCPVILISARLDKKIAIESFAHRVFDVLEKPYSLQDMVAKLQVALLDSKFKKKQFANQEEKPDWFLDRERRVFRYGTETTSLTLTEVKILDVLTLALNNVVPREKLLQEIWGSMTVAEHTLDVHLTNLRKKSPRFKTLIKGIRGVGYIFQP